MIQGSGTTSLRKQDLTDQKSIATGFVKTQFATKANAGDTGINLNSLTIPPEMSSQGFSNPSGAQLSAANLLNFRKNLRLVSSVRGVLIDQLSYTVASGTQINFLGFTALANEIFVGTIDYSAVNGIQVTSTSSVPASGQIPAGSNTASLGYAIPTNQYSTTQLGGALLYIDGVLQTRNTGNSSSVLDGNYYEQDNGSGNFSTFVLNVTDPVNVRNYLIVPNGLIVSAPDGATSATVQTQQGQINQLAQYVAALTGLSISTVLGGAPSYTDLLAFGNLLNTLNNNAALKGVSNTWTANQALPGQTLGASPASGIIGENSSTTLGSNLAVASSGSVITIVSQTLQPGIWLVTGDIYMSGSLTGTQSQFMVSLTNNGQDTLLYRTTLPFTSNSTADLSVQTPYRIFNFATATPVYLTGLASYSGGTANYIAARCGLSWVRIA